ncbi:hypothetical protein [Roseicyclus mahoneyensis]|nr:hypothetical protein [Roseicyclus mahoneyensis]
MTVPPEIAGACVFDPPRCATVGGAAFLQHVEGNVVWFNEWRDADQLTRRVLVECTSRQGIMVTDRPDDDVRLRQVAEEYFYEVMTDDVPQTLDQIVRTLRGRGVAAQRVGLSAGHCGCDLPSIPPPPSSCD